MKDGGKYAFLGMESREAGDAVINALNQQVHRSSRPFKMTKPQLRLSYIVILLLSFLITQLSGGEGERNHCEVEGGWNVDLRGSLL